MHKLYNKTYYFGNIELVSGTFLLYMAKGGGVTLYRNNGYNLVYPAVPKKGA
eukprot:SAG31_NODE_47833_length_214_cov_0.565217_1_plen_51_part_01